MGWRMGQGLRGAVSVFMPVETRGTVKRRNLAKIYIKLACSPCLVCVSSYNFRSNIEAIRRMGCGSVALCECTVRGTTHEWLFANALKGVYGVEVGFTVVCESVGRCALLRGPRPRRGLLLDLRKAHHPTDFARG